MRIDGRSNHEIRPIRIIPDYVPWAAGSVMIEYGNTQVLCNASVQESAPFHKIGSGEGWITVEYSMLPHAGLNRSDRESRTKTNGRTFEIQRLIGRSFRPGVDLRHLDGRTLHVDCDVIKADGGTRCASITGGWVALRIALSRLFEGKLPQGLFNHKWIAAVSVGIFENQIIVDLNYSEDSCASADMNLVCTDDNKWIEIQVTAEKEAQSYDVFNKMIEIAKKAASQLFEIQLDALSQAGCG